MDVAARIVESFIHFLKNVWGSANSPYITYRRLSESPNQLGQVVFVALLVIAYFSFASLIRNGIRSPLLLTIHFNTLVMAWCIGFFSMILLLYLLGIWFGAKVNLKALMLLWGYTLLPTLVWFFMTSLLYILIPPPRNPSIPGKVFSILYTSASIALFFWKGILYYLTLRFGLRLGLLKNLIITAVIIPLTIVYAGMMYKLGIFRIPFL